MVAPWLVVAPFAAGFAGAFFAVAVAVVGAGAIDVAEIVADDTVDAAGEPEPDADVGGDGTVGSTVEADADAVDAVDAVEIEDADEDVVVVSTDLALRARYVIAAPPPIATTTSEAIAIGTMRGAARGGPRVSISVGDSSACGVDDAISNVGALVAAAGAAGGGAIDASAKPAKTEASLPMSIRVSRSTNAPSIASTSSLGRSGRTSAIFKVLRRTICMRSWP